MRNRFLVFSRNDVIAYISLMLGASIGMGVYLGAMMIVFALNEYSPAVMILLAFISIPALMTPALLFAWLRNKIILFNSPRGLLWVIYSVITTTAVFTFLAPFLTAGLPLAVVCLVVQGKIKDWKETPRALGIGRFTIPAH
jgi:hypothetical protein